MTDAAAAPTAEDRARLLEAALAHVPFDGWTEAALRAGARDSGVDPAAFPGGPREALAAFSRWADTRMLKAMEAEDLSDLRIHERVALAVELRLEALEPYREAVRRGLSFLAMPQNAALGARLLYRTVDDVWYAVGDRSADFSFYTKRGLLAGVIGSTTLYWLDDRSEDGADTQAFLARRIDDVMRIYRTRHRAEEIGARAPNPFRIVRDVVKKRYGFVSE